MDYTKLKTKKQKWLEIALILAIIIIIIAFFAYSGLKNSSSTVEPITTERESDKWAFMNYILTALVLGFIYYTYNKNKGDYTTMTAYEVVNFVANEVYFHENMILDDKNTTVELGAPKETYVEFEKEARTFMLVDGEGIKEMYKGQAIKQIKNRKAKNEIASDLAKVGISDYKDLVKMERFNRIGEEE